MFDLRIVRFCVTAVGYSSIHDNWMGLDVTIKIWPPHYSFIIPSNGNPG